MGDRQSYHPQQQALQAEQEGMELWHQQQAEQQELRLEHPLEGMEHQAAYHP